MPTKSAYESDVIFTSKERAEMAVKGIYPVFKGTAMITYFTPDNDESTSTNTSGERYGLSKYDFGPANNQMRGSFDTRYTGINRANECIDGIINAGVMESGSQNDIKFFKSLYGESLTLRAWAYFDLVRYWGDVPFPLSPSKAGQDFNLPRTSRDSIYDRIIEDLTIAEEIVPWASEVGYKDRITKGAVKGLKARIALHAAGYSLRWDLETGSNLGMRKRNDETRINELYSIAKQACEDVIIHEGVEHGLDNTYENIFKDSHNKKSNKENIFELGNYGISANDGVGYYIGLSIGAVPGVYLAGAPQVRALPTYYYSFDPQDNRRDVACANFSIEKTTGNFNIVTANNLTCGKWRRCWQDNQGPENGKTDINWIVLRYADILLMYAEAVNEINFGPTESAKNALKKVRKRAFSSESHPEKVENYVNELSTKEDFLEAIIKERSFELGFEANLRRTDLIRWNRLAKAIEDTRNKMEVLATQYNPYTGEKIPKYRIYLKESFMGNVPTSIQYTESDNNQGLEAGFFAVLFINTNNIRSMINNYAKAFEENKTELLPLHQSVIDGNSNLRNAQHPGY